MNITIRSLDSSKGELESLNQKPVKRRVDPTPFVSSDIHHKEYLAGETGPETVRTKPRARKGSSRLALPVQEANPEAVCSFMRDCLVPVLAEEFLRRRLIEDEQSLFKVTPRKPTTGPFGKEGGL